MVSLTAHCFACHTFSCSIVMVKVNEPGFAKHVLSNISQERFKIKVRTSFWRKRNTSFPRLYIGFCVIFFSLCVMYGFSSPELTLCSESYSVSLPVLPQWHENDPGLLAKSVGGRLHLNTHTPLTQRSRSGLTMPLSRQNVRTYLKTNSHATCQGTFGQMRLSSPNHCGLILA